MLCWAQVVFVRVLYLTSEYLWPPHHGGRVRSLAQLRLIASLPEVTGVTMLSFTEVPITAADEAGMAAAAPGVTVQAPVHHPVHLRQHPLALLRVALRRGLSGQPYLAAKWESPALRRALVALSAERFDLLYVDHLGMAGYLDELRRLWPLSRLVIEAHNVESDFFHQLAGRQRGPLRHAALFEWRATARFEAQVLRAADAVVAISAADAAVLAARSFGLTVTVPQVVTPAPVAAAVPAALQLGYVGNLTWHPNVRGLDWFCEEVWPLVRATAPAAQLCIAGSGLGTDAAGRPRVPPRWQKDGVRVAGFLPDLTPLYAGSRAMIAPILDGSGVRIKLLEALRAGMPVVTTTAGAAGLPLSSGREVLIADDPAGFAAASLRLLREPALGAALRAAGLRFLQEHHGLPVAQAAMRRALGLLPTG